MGNDMSLNYENADALTRISCDYHATRSTHFPSLARLPVTARGSQGSGLHIALLLVRSVSDRDSRQTLDIVRPYRLS